MISKKRSAKDIMASLNVNADIWEEFSANRDLNEALDFRAKWAKKSEAEKRSTYDEILGNIHQSLVSGAGDVNENAHLDFGDIAHQGGHGDGKGDGERDGDGDIFNACISDHGGFCRWVMEDPETVMSGREVAKAKMERVAFRENLDYEKRKSMRSPMMSGKSEQDLEKEYRKFTMISTGRLSFKSDLSVHSVGAMRGANVNKLGLIVSDANDSNVNYHREMGMPPPIRWGIDWLGRTIWFPYSIYGEGDQVRMNYPTPYDLPEEEMDPGLMKVKNIVKELFDKKQKRLKDESLAELLEIKERVIGIYSSYGIDFCFPDETEEQRQKREKKINQRLEQKAREAAAARKAKEELEDFYEDESVTKEEEQDLILIGGMPLDEASKLTGIPPNKLLKMSEGMRDLMVWLQKKKLEEDDRQHLADEIIDSNKRAIKRTQVLLEANRWLQALGIDLTNPNIECPYNDTAQNEMHARHHNHAGLNANVFTRVAKLIAKTVIMSSYILQEYFGLKVVPEPEPETEEVVEGAEAPAPAPAKEEPATEAPASTNAALSLEQINKNAAKSGSDLALEAEQSAGAAAVTDAKGEAMTEALLKEVRQLQEQRLFFTDTELMENTELWKEAVENMERQFNKCLDMSYTGWGKQHVLNVKKHAKCIERTFEQQLSVITMRGAELDELQATLRLLQMELYDCKLYHKMREDAIAEKTKEKDLWNFRIKELERGVANYLRTIQMFDMEYKANITKTSKRVTESLKYTANVAADGKVKEKPEMEIFPPIVTGVKEFDAKMALQLKEFQADQRQRQLLLFRRIEEAKKTQGEFPPRPPPTTDYNVICPQPKEKKKKGKGKGKGKGKNKAKSYASEVKNFNFSDEEDKSRFAHRVFARDDDSEDDDDDDTDDSDDYRLGEGELADYNENYNWLGEAMNRRSPNMVDVPPLHFPELFPRPLDPDLHESRPSTACTSVSARWSRGTSSQGSPRESVAKGSLGAKGSHGAKGRAGAKKSGAKKSGAKTGRFRRSSATPTSTLCGSVVSVKSRGKSKERKVKLFPSLSDVMGKKAPSLPPPTPLPPQLPPIKKSGRKKKSRKE